jgi:hypothetical protein
MILRLLVEHPTRASNAREHPMARAGRVNKERNAVAEKFRLLAAGYPGLLVPDQIRRRPRGLSRDDLALAKKTGADLRVLENILRPAAPLLVTLTRISAGKLDPFDNLPQALKGMVDEIARQLGVDDKDPLVKYVAKQERGARGYNAVRIEIELQPGAVMEPRAPQQGALL